MDLKRKLSGHKPLPDVDYLKECFDYRDGRLYWRHRPKKHFPKDSDRVHRIWNTRYAGNVAGRVMECGYRIISVDGQYYLSSRLVYHMESGPIPPKMQVDHIDRNRDNDLLENLRLCTNAENNMNQARRKRPKYEGLPKNITWSLHEKKYKVRIRANGIRHHLGTYETLEEAAAVASAERTRLHHQFACDAPNDRPMAS